MTTATNTVIAVNRKFVAEKETKNAVKFTEVPEPGEPEFFGSLYVKKFALQRAGSPKEITVTVEAS